MILLILLVIFTGFCPYGGVYAKSENVIITLCYQGKEYIYNFEENLPEINTFVDSKKLQKNNRLASSNLRAELIENIINIGFSPLQAIDYMLFGFEEFYSNIKQEIECEMEDAQIIFDTKKNPMFSIKEEKIGYKISDTNLIRNIISEMKKSNLVNVEIEPEKTLPKHTKKELVTWTTKLSSFSTNYATSTENRKHNVSRAIGRFDGKVVQPNEIVSFNATTGKRTSENGYKEAKIIQDREYVEAFGGGVCQSSTTLYNALILAGVEIKEVHPHSLSPNYVEYGFDAMVNYGTSDLKFCNTNETPLFIHTHCTNDTVKVEIYGKPKDNYVRKRVNEIVEKISPEPEKIIVDAELEYIDKVLYEDEEWYQTYPKNGYKVKSYIEIYENGKLLNKKKIREVKYHSVRGVKIKGSKKREIVQEKIENLSNWHTLDKLLA